MAFYRHVEKHYECFEQVCPDRHEDRYGFFRAVSRETVYKYLGCGDLKQGFARARCRDCGGSMRIVAFIEDPQVVCTIREQELLFMF